MSLIKFLYEVSDIDLQLKIKREINGEADTDDDEEDDDEEEEEIAEEEKTESKDNKDPRRKESPTLWAILRRYYTKDVPSSTTDWTCFIEFFKSTVHQLDMDYDIGWLLANALTVHFLCPSSPNTFTKKQLRRRANSWI